MDFSNPDLNIDHYFYEIDLSKEEKIELLPKLDATAPVGGGEDEYFWDLIYNIEGTIYRVYGQQGDFTLKVDLLIVRLEPHDTHSGR
jgi:hypothetical protein